MQQLNTGNAWQYTLTLLGGGSVLHGLDAAHHETVDAVPARRANLAFVDVCKDNLISVSWSDPTSGHYTEQLWRLCIARKRGICALTGSDIQRGDKIYRPFSRGAAPGNANWAVLASALDVDLKG
ncbi:MULTISPECIES: DUF3331 domain-containing protein [unclassified Paraburkholderia]|uniref:DUF3331 domain-containing protein n=1 Tax=unclassified Paraburkholderia TaxID=2615204 RepID=UPI00197D6C9D|nr:MULTISPECIES: DUF3331 domain-containing protein [unclassified Paraburkholderia]MBN3852184.1 DUF3331 domain-containing protein [Paraburkholderia sp. Ac-20340]